MIKKTCLAITLSIILNGCGSDRNADQKSDVMKKLDEDISKSVQIVDIGPVLFDSKDDICSSKFLDTLKDAWDDRSGSWSQKTFGVIGEQKIFREKVDGEVFEYRYMILENSSLFGIKIHSLFSVRDDYNIYSQGIIFVDDFDKTKETLSKKLRHTPKVMGESIEIPGSDGAASATVSNYLNKRLGINGYSIYCDTSSL